MEKNPTVRKFIDLICDVSGKRTNWDPPIPIAVGDYGTLDANGELIVEGNIYKPEFQKLLDESGAKLDLKAFSPKLGAADQDYIAASTGVKRGNLDVNANANVPGIASASIRGTWKFRDGKRGALIILHSPQQRFIPPEGQTAILKTGLLVGKKVVTTALTCPAYLLYLSDKSGGEFSVALCGRTAVPDAINGELGLQWWTNNESALLRRACNTKGKCHFTPLFTLREKVKRRWWSWRGEGEPGSAAHDSEEDEYEWREVSDQPWKPLDEDGYEIDDD